MSNSVALPRIAITYCTQCKWLLRAAYFAQELLSTFGTTIGEVALIPATGGIFTVYLTHKPDTADVEAQQVLLWDRKAEGGFPETKILKQRVRNHIEPDKNLGHSDTPSSTKGKGKERASPADEAAREQSSGYDANPSVSTETDPLLADASSAAAAQQECEDCK